MAEEFSTNDLYLIDEYKKRGTDDYYLTDLADKTFVVPYYYSKRGANGWEAAQLFKKDLLDFQDIDVCRYQKAGKKLRTIRVGDDELIIPYKTGVKYNEEEIIRQIVDKAEVKYNAVINGHRLLDDFGMTVFSTDMLNSYTKELAKQKKSLLLAPEACKYLKMYNNLCESIQNNMAPKSAGKMLKKLRNRIINAEFKSLGKFKPKYWKLALLAGMVSVSVFHLCHSTKDYGKEKVKALPKDTVAIDTIPTFTDFKGTVYTDTLGSLQRMRELQPQIMTMLIALEGYAENAFLDGNGNPTVGSGFTVFINEDGSLRKINKGDKTTLKEDVIQNTRYIEREFPALLGDNFGRKLRDEEFYGCIGSGYCWGTQQLFESNFFKSVKGNETVENQCRKLTGFRKPIGLIKREFLLAQLMRGNWKIDDLLDLPVYYLKGKGYVHCGIYTLDFHNYLPCKKDKKGRYIKDTKGRDMPLKKGEFCLPFYNPPFQEILKKIKNNPANRGAPYKTVRELLHEDLLSKFNMQTPQAANIFYTSSFYKGFEK